MKLDEVQVGKLVEIHRSSFGVVTKIKRDGPRSKVWVRIGGYPREFDYSPSQIQAEADEYGRQWFADEEEKGAARTAERERVGKLTQDELEEEYGDRLDALARAQEELAEMELHVRELTEGLGPLSDRIQAEDRRRRLAGERGLVERNGRFPKLLV